MTDKTVSRRAVISTVGAAGVGTVIGGGAASTFAETAALSDQDLAKIIDDPKKFFADPSSRARALGRTDEQLASELSAYAKREGVPAGKDVIKEIITTIKIK